MSMSVHERPIYELLEVINKQIGHLRSVCESGGEFLGRSVLHGNY